MKRVTAIITFLLFIAFGILIGIRLNTGTDQDLDLLYSSDINTQEVVELRKANEDMKTRIGELKKQVDELEQERANESIPLQKLKNQVEKYKLLAGYSPVMGPGAVISLESSLNENIALIVEEKKYLLNLVNELRVFGGEVISLNNHRITSRSEIAQAGKHINVNGTPIAPPYIVQVIGDVEALKRYVQHRTIIFEMMSMDGIKANISFQDEIQILPLAREKPIEFLKPVED